MAPPPRFIVLTDAEKISLTLIHKSGRTHRERQRAECILLNAQSMDARTLSKRYCICYKTINLWLNRYKKDNPNCLLDAQRPGRPPRMSPLSQKKFKKE